MVTELKNCFSITKKLKREENKFIHRKAETICQKEFPHTFQYLNKKIGPFKLGHTYTMENFIARIFVEADYLKFTDEYHINSQTIQKINFQESTSKQLNKIQDLIYIQAREHLKIAQKQYQHDQIQYRDMSRLKSDINDLSSVRIGKINRLARHSRNLEAKKRLTDEELVLYEKLGQAFKEWQDYLNNT